MNSLQAKRIPLQQILAQLGHQPHHQVRGDLWYLSPFRNEANPSFKVNEEKNVFYDFGEGEGGNVIDFIQTYFNLTQISDVLKKIEELTGSFQPQASVPTERFASNCRAESVFIPMISRGQSNKPMQVRKIQPLQNRALIAYLQQRGIPKAIAEPYLSEIYYTRNDRNYFALAFENESGGYELRNPYFKGVHGQKDISIIEERDLLVKRKRGEGGSAITVFEGVFDFLSAITYYQKHITTPVIVENSVALKNRAYQAIRERNVNKVYLYLDRDDSGRKLTDTFCRELSHVTVLDKSSLYAQHKDFSDFLVESR